MLEGRLTVATALLGIYLTLWVIPPPLPKYKIKKYSLFLWIIPTKFAALFRLFMTANYYLLLNTLK